MCGRYSLHSNPDVIALMFGLSEIPAYQPRYNIAPTAQVLIIRQNEAAMVRWGLVPRWAKDPAMGARMNNARAETVARKTLLPRGLPQAPLPDSGQRLLRMEAGKRPQAALLHPPSRRRNCSPSRACGSHGRTCQTCAIITTEANAEDGRGPRPHAGDPRAARIIHAGSRAKRGLLQPCASNVIDIRRVSRAVNNARNDLPELIEPDEG